MHLPRLLIASVLVAAGLVSLGVADVSLGVADPPVVTSGSSAATSPSASPASGTWSPVDGVLGNGIPGLTIDSTPPVAWDARFWTIEQALVAQPPGDQPDVTVWRDPALWQSSDGRTWERRALPAAMTGDLSLLVWRNHLTIVERRDRPGRVRHVVWRSRDGRRWRRVGSLVVRSTGDLRGCELWSEFQAVAGRRLVLTTSCPLLRGASGSVGPSIASVAASARTRRRTYPTFVWTSDDGRTWSRQTLLDGRVSHGDVEGLAILRSVGRGVAALTSGAHARLLWSTDGQAFHEVATLPAGSPEDIDATADASGRTRVWLLLMRDAPVEGTVPGSAADPPAVMRLDGDAWVEVARLDTAPVDGPSPRGSIEVDGDRVMATIERSLLTTLVSLNSGTTWTVSSDPGSVGYCDPRVAISGELVVLGCDDEDGAPMRWGRMP